MPFFFVRVEASFVASASVGYISVLKPVPILIKRYSLVILERLCSSEAMSCF